MNPIRLARRSGIEVVIATTDRMVKRPRAGVGWTTLTALALIAVAPAAVQAQPAAAARESVPGPGELSPATIRMLQHSLIQGGYAVDAADGAFGALAPDTVGGTHFEALLAEAVPHQLLDLGFDRLRHLLPACEPTPPGELTAG